MFRFYPAFLFISLMLLPLAACQRIDLQEGELAYEEGNYQKAIQTFHKILEKDSSVAEAYEYRGYCYMDLGAYPLCIRDLEKARELGTHNHTLYNNLGHCYTKTENDPMALRYFYKAIELQPDDSVTMMNLAISLNNNGKFEEALPYAKKLLAMNRENLAYYYIQGVAYLGLQDTVQAIESYSDALKMDPGNFIFLNERGIIYGMMGRFDLAIQDFKAAIKDQPEDADSYLNLVLAYLQKGDTATACLHSQTLKRLEPAYRSEIDSVCGE